MIRMPSVTHLGLPVALALGLAACGTSGGDNDGPLLDPEGNEFTYQPVGDLVEGSGEGTTDQTIYFPGLRFPMESAPAYPNSQVYAAGGSRPPEGATGGQCAEGNYSYPWRDNFCEFRSWNMPLCPLGTGHQGQDIRPATCEKSVHWVVAGEPGQITGIGSYSVTLLGESGTIHRYLHMDMSQLAVSTGDTVTRGQRLGLVSNDFGGTPTTIHLHYDIRQAVTLDDGRTVFAYVPPYTSLVKGYQKLLKGKEE